MKKGSFTKGVEQLINPIDVGTIHCIQYFNRLMPTALHHKMVSASGKKSPYMGFVVEPYSFFLCYEIEDLNFAKRFLPKGFSLVKATIFEGDTPKYYGIIGCFTTHTSAFWGSRVEYYIVAEDGKTGMQSWIICDYDTNTITYDPKYGLHGPNTVKTVVTTDYNGVVWVDVENKKGRKLSFHSDITKGQSVKLSQRLWIEGNLSIAYGRNRAKENPGLFSVLFDHKEYTSALRIPLDDLEMEYNNWFPGMCKAQPAQIICFPYAQHLLSDSPGSSSGLQTPEQMKQAVEMLEISRIQPYSTKAYQRAMLLGGLASVVTQWTLLYLLLRKRKT